MSEVAEKAGEIAAEVVEESVDGIVDVVEVVRNNPMVLVAVGAAGLIAGAVGGYFIAKQQLRSYYEDLATQEIAEAREFYAGVYKTDDQGNPLTPMEVLESRHGSEAAAKAMRGYLGVDEEDSPEAEAELEELDEEVLTRTVSKVKTRYRKQAEDEEAEEEQSEQYEKHVPPTRRNTFEDNSFNLDEERELRTADKPYIITHDEYFENEGDLDQTALTYFELDDTLVYEEDEMKPIEDSDGLVGDNHLQRFGSGSKDPNKLYIRNEKIGTMYEIARSKGSYLEEVLGLPTDEPDSLRHSAQRDRRRAFRREDE